MKKVLFLIPIALLFTQGCLGLSSYQNPEILPRGKKTLGVSVPLVLNIEQVALGLITPEFYGRVGLGHGLDLGWRTPIFLLSSGFFLGINGDLRYGHTWSCPDYRTLFTLKGNLWMSNQGFLLLTSPQLGLGFQHSLVSVGPVLWFTSEDAGKWAGWRLESTQERRYTWGALRPEVTLTYHQDRDNPGDHLWLLTMGTAVEVDLDRILRK